MTATQRARDQSSGGIVVRMSRATCAAAVSLRGFSGPNRRGDIDRRSKHDSNGQDVLRHSAPLRRSWCNATATLARMASRPLGCATRDSAYHCAAMPRTRKRLFAGRRLRPHPSGLTPAEIRAAAAGDIDRLAEHVESRRRRCPRALQRSVWRDAAAARRAAGRSGGTDAVSARPVGRPCETADGRHRNDRPLPRSDRRGARRTGSTSRRTATIGCRR